MKGRNTVVVGIRISEARFGILKKVADGKGVTVSALLKGKVEEFADKLDGGSVNSLVNTTKVIPLYNPAIHKAGERVLIRHGKRLVEAVVPELDAEGREIYAIK